MLAGTTNRYSGQNSNRFGATLITTQRLVADEITSCHLTTQAQVINVDQAGTLPSVGSGVPASCGQSAVAAPPPGTTCFTSLATALERVNNQVGGTIINLAAGTYTLPEVDLPVNDLKIVGDTCPVVGIAYLQGARRNSLAENFIADNLLSIQGSGVTSLSINGQTITVTMSGGDPDFTQCADLVGHTVRILSIPGGTGTGVLSTHTITAVTANSITISGVMPLTNVSLAGQNGEGFVIVPNVTLSAADGTQVKSMKRMEFEGVVFQAASTLYVHAEEQNYLNSIIDTDTTLFVGGKGVTGTGVSVIGHLVSAHNSQQLWSLGAVLGQEATVLADGSSFGWQFSVASGAELPLHAQNGARLSLFGTDLFLNVTGASATSQSVIAASNAWADGNDVGFLVENNSSVTAEGIPSILGFSVIPFSATNNDIGAQARFASHIWDTGVGSLPIAALDLPAYGSNTTADYDLDDATATGSVPIAGGHDHGNIAPAGSASGFSHIYAAA